MMRGYNWFNDGFCSFGAGRYLSIWHYLILAGLVIVIIGIISMRRKKHESDGSLEVLKGMYVNGDISEEEYLKRKSVLERK